jgi:hypothetical protein
METLCRASMCQNHISGCEPANRYIYIQLHMKIVLAYFSYTRKYSNISQREKVVAGKRDGLYQNEQECQII